MQLEMLDAWQDRLDWNPSECYRRFQYQGQTYRLYLRWRWQDPWQGYIIKDLETPYPALDDFLSPELFLINHCQYASTELDLAKHVLEGLAEEYLKVYGARLIAGEDPTVIMEEVCGRTAPKQEFMDLVQADYLATMATMN